MDDLNDIKNSRGLNIAHLNSNGLLSKLEYIKIKLNKSCFSIFSISESQRDTNILDEEIKIDGDVSYRLDWNRHS